MEQYIVETLGKRLDKFVSDKKKDLSRMAVQRLIEEGKITVNAKKEKASYVLKNGDIIQVEEIIPVDTQLKPQEIPLDVIYEDESIIVINKQKGMVVHPGSGNKDQTLANAVLAKCKTSLSGIGGKTRPGIVHRLDKDTSGIIIIAKNDMAHLCLSEQIGQRQVKKTYLALVRNLVKENEATIDMPIGRSSKDRKKMAIVKTGKPAITHFNVIKRYQDCTLLEVNIETGRTHQIRVHLSEIGYPIIGDEVYSNGKNRFGVKGQMLHAQKIEFVHPKTMQKMVLEAKLPKYFQDILDILEKEG